MADIVIHHCKLRIVRRDGWAWGPEPQRLLQSAMRMLPALLARQLEGLWEDGDDYEIAAPVRITIPVRMSELMAADVEHASSDSTLEDAPLSALHSRLAQALRLTFLRDHSPPAGTAHAGQLQSQKSREEMDMASELRWSSTLLCLLLSWYEQGVLATRLDLCALPPLEAWSESLCTMHSPSLAGVTAVPPEAIDHLLRDLAPTIPDPTPNRAAMLRRWLALAVAIVHHLGALPGDAVVQQALHQVLPLSTLNGNHSATASALLTPPHTSRHAADVEKSIPAAPEQAGRVPVPQRVQPPPPSSAAVLHEGEVSVPSALPFLLLGPLTRCGYLQTLAAVLEAADSLPQMRLFATALAYKVLDPPARGWRRHPTAAPAAASFAALAAPVPEPELAAFAQHMSAYLSPLDAVLTDMLAAGHNPQQPLLLYRTEPPNGLLLVDVEGIFPMAWAEGLEALSPTLTRCQASPLFVPLATADPQLLSQLDGANVCFITDAPPTRHERWRPLRHPPLGRWWTNDALTAESQLVKTAQLLIDTAEETAMLWRAFAVERPAIAVLPNTAFDCSLTLAAAVALGTIAWALWRQRESVAPQLTLARFRDLDARVRFSRESVRVRLPLGRRYRDLYEHGLLDDVRDVPWFDGRVLQFSGG